MYWYAIRSAVFAFACVCLCLLPGVHAQSPAPAVAEAAKLPVHGSSCVSGGAVTASDGDLAIAVLAVGDPVFVGDRISAMPRQKPCSRPTMRAILRCAVVATCYERFSAKGNPSDQLWRIFAGALRVVTATGHTNRPEREFHPSATIGIRGTDHEPYVMSLNLPASCCKRRALTTRSIVAVRRWRAEAIRST
jgi:hypothetical protein